LANPELGAKQVCPSCQAKFYDLGRRPAVCPKCATEFDPEEAVRSRRVRPRTPEPDYEDDPKPDAAKEAADTDEDTEDAPEIDEVVEADPVETDEADDPVDAAPATDLGVDFEEEGAELDSEAEDVPFLEDEADDFVEDEIEPRADDEER
jgi:uncharacterized protein (TIGR02300 family)